MNYLEEANQEYGFQGDADHSRYSGHRGQESNEMLCSCEGTPFGKDQSSPKDPLISLELQSIVTLACAESKTVFHFPRTVIES